LVGDPVPGDTGLVLDDGLAAADDAVHEGRLADIGAANDGEYGERAVSGGLDGALHVLEVEALLRGELHELRVLGVAERPVVVLGRALVGVRAVGLDVVVHEVRTSSFIVVVGGAPGHGHATTQCRSAPGEAPRVLQVRGELLLDAFGGRVQRLAGAPSAAVAGLERVAEDDVDAGAQRGQRLDEPPGPVGAAQDGHGHDGCPAAHGEVGQPGPDRGEVALAPGPLGEYAEGAAVLQHAQGARARGAVGGVRVHLELADPGEERVERADEGFLLDQEVRGAGCHAHDHRSVEVVGVVDGEDQRAARGNSPGAQHPRSEQPVHQADADAPPDLGTPRRRALGHFPARFSSTRVTTHSMTCSRVSSVVSTSTASSALASGEVLRLESAASRLIRASRVALTSAPLSSPLRRAARASGEAVRKILRSASGSTVVPMSRPSTTMPVTAAAAIARCSSVIRVRTSGTALTALTLAVTSCSRIGPATSVPSTVMAGAFGSVPETISGLPAAAAIAAGSSVSMPLVTIHQVIARYWAPVSR